MNKNRLTAMLALILALAMLLALTGCGSAQPGTPAESTEVQSASVSEEVPTEEAPAEEASAEEVSVPAPAEEPAAEEEASMMEEGPAEEAPADGSFTLTEPELPLVDDTATFTWWMPVNPLAFLYVESLDEISVMKYVEEKTNVHIDFTNVGGNEVDNLLPLMIASGDYCDFLGSVSGYSTGLSGAIKEGVIIDMADYWEEYCPNYYARVTADDDFYHVVCSDDGEITGFGQLKYNGVIEAGLAIRQDFLDKLNMDMPKTYDQLHDFLSAAKSDLGINSGLWLNPTGVGNMHTFSAGYGVAATNQESRKYIPYVVKDGKVSYSYTESGMKDYLAMASQWYEEGLIWKDFATGGEVYSITFSDAYNEVLNGQMAVFYCESGDLTTIPASVEDGMVLAAMPEPVVSEGDQIHTVPAPDKINMVASISTACEDVELACRYFDYYYTEEMEQVGTFGIEGEAYELDADGNMVFTDLIVNNPDGMPMRVAMTLYCFEDMPFATNYDRTYMVSTPEAVEAMQLWTADSDGAWNYPVNATFNSDESTEYASLYADISTYVSESVPQFINGTLSVEKDYDAFQQRLVDMGIDRCVELRQQAYDRFVNK